MKVCGTTAPHCDELVSLPKPMLTSFVARLSPGRLADVDRALVTALGIDVTAFGESA